MVIVSRTIKKEDSAEAVVKKAHTPQSYDGFIFVGGKLLAVISTMGTNYNPANTKITEAKLIIKQSSLYELVSDAKTSADTEKQNIIDFNEGYKMMPAITTDSLNAFRASENILASQVKIAGNNAKRVRGTRIITIKEIVPPVTEAIVDSGDKELNVMRRNSVSRQKFAVRLGNFYTYISYINSVSNYNTNEVRLKSEALLTYYNSLKTLMATLEASESATNSKRDARNEGFFNNETGARKLYSQAKTAIASMKGLTGSDYKQVKGLPFKNLIKVADRTPTTNY